MSDRFKAKACEWLAFPLLLVLLAGCSAKNGWMLRGQEPPKPQSPVNEQAVAEFSQAVDLAVKLQFIEAEAKFSQLLPIFQAAEDHNRAAECTFWIGYCEEKQNQPEQAQKFYQNVVENYSKTPAAGQASARLAALTARGSTIAKP